MGSSPAITPESVPVYLPFTSFRSAVQSLRAHGLPDRIDKTAWQSRSGGEQSQLISAFKFLNLIDDKQDTQDSLRKLIDAQENTDEEKAILRDLLQTHYGKVFALNLKTATPGQLADAIASYGATGATRDRAVRFFLKAADHIGIPMSTRLTANMRSRATSTAPGNGEDEEAGTSGASTPAATRTRRRRRGVLPLAPPPAGTPSQNTSGNAMKTIQLPEVAGSLSVMGTFNPLQLMGEERELVYKIVDLMTAYEKKGGPAK